MRVLLVSANRTDINMQTVPLGLGCVASAAAEAGHEVRLLDLMEVDDISNSLRQAVAAFDPEVIGVSVRNIDNQNMHDPQAFLDEIDRIVAEIKGLTRAPVVLGGAGYSLFPGSLLLRSGADMGIQGEGEDSFCLLLQGLEQKTSLSDVPGLYRKGMAPASPRTYGKNPDRLPLPDPGILNLAGVVPVQTRRGCPLRCSYCATSLIEGTRLRKRSPDRIIRWISSLVRQGARQLYFVDNTFNLPASYALQLCQKLKTASLGVTWWCILYPFRVAESLVSAMAEAGCVEVSLGFESGSERMLSAMNKRFNRRDITDADRLLRTYGIRRMGFLLLGGPGETRDSVEESLAFADSLGLDSLKITVGIRIYPQTHLAEQARQQGIVNPDDDLLSPRFYMAPGLEDWIMDRVAEYVRTRPHCIA